MNKKKYIQPELRVMKYSTQDVIASSYEHAETSGLGEDNLSGAGDDDKITSQDVWGNAW